VTVAYWLLAGLLALFYLYSGTIKVVQSKDQLRPMMAWVDSVPTALLRTIGLLEVLGALGLIVPPLTGIAVGLAIAAAAGLALIQVGGLTLHLSRREPGATRRALIGVLLPDAALRTDHLGEELAAQRLHSKRLSFLTRRWNEEGCSPTTQGTDARRTFVRRARKSVRFPHLEAAGRGRG
jgi:hypothetical protein